MANAESLQIEEITETIISTFLLNLLISDLFNN